MNSQDHIGLDSAAAFSTSYSRATLPDDLNDFRDEVRLFCAEHLPQDIRAKVIANQRLEKADHVRWQKILTAKGWFVGFWPEAYGGLGWSALKRWVFENEMYYHGSPWLIPFGLAYVAPVLYTYGSEEQRRKFLPDIRNSDAWWAQGYSEPGAGSDLANIATRAVRDGNEWVVTGTKIWTTMAQWADMMFAIVRTEASDRPQRGLSFILIDLKSPGVTIRPIRTIDAVHHVNEVILDEVRIPIANLIGEEGRGWAYAKFLLGNERLLGADVGRSTRMLEDLRALAGRTYEGGVPLIKEAGWRRRIAAIEIRLMALESMAITMLSEQQQGADPGAKASVLKLIGSEIAQDIEGASIDLLGHTGLSFQTEALDAGWQGRAVGPIHTAGLIRDYLHGRASTIYGGSSEVQKNIVAKAVLDL